MSLKEVGYGGGVITNPGMTFFVWSPKSMLQKYLTTSTSQTYTMSLAPPSRCVKGHNEIKSKKTRHKHCSSPKMMQYDWSMDGVRGYP